MLRKFIIHRVFKFAACCSVSVLLLGCTPQQQSKSPDTGDGGLLSSDSTCTPPCFWGISPGTTTEGEVNKILQGKALLSACQVSNNQGGARDVTCGSGLLVTYRQGTDVVDGIGINPSLPVTVGDVIKTYGDPSAVLVTLQGTPEEKQRTSVILYFDSIYTTLVLPDQQGYSFDLKATTTIENIGYFDRASYELSRQYSSPWLGYGMYAPLQR